MGQVTFLAESLIFEQLFDKKAKIYKFYSRSRIYTREKIFFCNSIALK